jgi:hypothetical protein
MHQSSPIKLNLLLFFLPLFGFGQISYRNLDSTSSRLYLTKDWEALHQLSRSDLPESGPAIWRRFAAAEWELQHYTRSERWARKSYRQNVYDQYSKMVLMHSLLANGEEEAARTLSDSVKAFSIQNIQLQLGNKFSTFSNPQDLLYTSLETSLTMGRHLSLDLGYGFMQQRYFWEDLRQQQILFSPRWQFNDRWSLNLPTQFGLYSADVIGNFITEEGINGSARNGFVDQQIFQTQLMLEFTQNAYSLSAGIGWFQNDSRAAYDLLFESIPPLPPSRQDSSSLQEQLHFHIDMKYRLPWWKEKVELQLKTQWIDRVDAIHLNLRPALLIGPFANTYLYAEYLQKGPYMLADPSAMLMLNNSNSEEERVLVSFEHHMKNGHIINLSYFYEWGTDELYFNQDFAYHGLFVSYTLPID